jgi:chemotaxis protein methyltransferase WspC
MNMDSVETWLRGHCGLEADSLGPGVVARAVTARCAQLGCQTFQAYFERLVSSPAEQQELVGRVVVAETWFFRDRAALESVARRAVERAGSVRAGAVFRVLCVPCSTGEEPYSIAMAFAQAGWPLERLAIDAVDISRGNILRAREGIYRKNSFRGGDLSFRDAFFETAGPDAWKVIEGIRAPITFAEGNVLAPDFSHGRGAYDAIFCRNLLIYFDRSTQDQVIITLGGLLASGGLFAVGPAEPVLLFEHGYAALKIPAAFLLERASPRRAVVATPEPLPPLKKRTAVVFETKPVPKPVRGNPVSTPVVTVPLSEKPDTLATIQALADAGKLAEAAARGSVLLERGPTPELLYLLGLIGDARGEAARAVELYRKTLYLAPGHAGALAQLAFHAEKAGDLRGARMLRARAERSHGKEEPAA